MRILILSTALLLAGCGDAADVLGNAEKKVGNETTQTEAEGAAVSSYGNGVVTIESPDDVATTIERLEAALEDAGFGIVAKLDHQKNAGKVDLDLPPAVVISFGKPEAGTPLMQEAPEAALDLPQRMAVFVKDGATVIAYNDPVWLASRHGIIGQKERLDAMSAALEGLAQAAAGNTPSAAEAAINEVD
ncbi:MAG: DUF302 domain-containing protein [Sphingomonas sp.]|nr:DUF302 domain-containing protein [Sphingomonas sp.]RZV53173.1 MAG: DUF302 domain-containing protein [Sphingomonadaceae bacterium]